MEIFKFRTGAGTGVLVQYYESYCTTLQDVVKDQWYCKQSHEKPILGFKCLELMHASMQQIRAWKCNNPVETFFLQIQLWFLSHAYQMVAFLSFDYIINIDRIAQLHMFMPTCRLVGQAGTKAVYGWVGMEMVNELLCSTHSKSLHFSHTFPVHLVWMVYK